LDARRRPLRGNRPFLRRPRIFSATCPPPQERAAPGTLDDLFQARGLLFRRPRRSRESVLGLPDAASTLTRPAGVPGTFSGRTGRPYRVTQQDSSGAQDQHPGAFPARPPTERASPPRGPLPAFQAPQQVLGRTARRSPPHKNVRQAHKSTSRRGKNLAQTCRKPRCAHTGAFRSSIEVAQPPT